MAIFCRLRLRATCSSHTSTVRYLNLGCGARFHPDWVNLDLHPQHSSVRQHDLKRMLPFPAAEFDAVYQSHVLEHLPRDQVRGFLHECLRVLRPGGTVRVVVPDLEQIATLYLAALGAAERGDEEAHARHRWLLLELYDQVTRETPGGEMLDTLKEPRASRFAWHRLGADGAAIERHLRQTTQRTPAAWHQRWKLWLRGPWRERLLRRLLGHEYALLQLGRFRRAGEVHHWMYDRLSLRSLLTTAGFDEFRVAGPALSRIPGWAAYGLDANPDGTPAKPDSLYVEAVKP